MELETGHEFNELETGHLVVLELWKGISVKEKPSHSGPTVVCLLTWLWGHPYHTQDRLVHCDCILISVPIIFHVPSKGENMPPQNMPLGHLIILNYSWLRNSQYKKDTLTSFVPLKPGNKSPMWKVYLHTRRIESIFITRDRELRAEMVV